MSSESECRLIEKLDGTDWNKWKWQVDMLLRSHGLDTLVYGTRKCPVVGEDPTNEEKREQQKWMKDDAKASLIACSSSRNIAELVLTCKHANEIWTKLLERFERSNVQRLNSLIEKFFKMEHDTSEDFREGRKRDNDEFENFYVHKPKPNGTETGSGNGTRSPIISNETDNTNSTGSESEESKSDDNGNACEESSEEEVQEEPGRPKTIRTGKPGRPRKEYFRKGNSFSLYSERSM